MKPFEKIIPEQELGLRKAIWWVARELRQESESTLSDEVVFVVRENSDGVSQEEQRRAIRFLLENDIIKTSRSWLSTSSYKHEIFKIQNEMDGTTHQPIQYRLKLDTGALKGLYGAYEAFFSGKKQLKLSFEEVSGTLRFNSKSTRFNPSSHSFLILSTLLNSRDNFYEIGDSLSFKEINDAITFDGSANEIPIKSFYSAQKHINSKAEKDLEIADLLILRNAMVSINEKYLEEDNR